MTSTSKAKQLISTFGKLSLDVVNEIIEIIQTEDLGYWLEVKAQIISQLKSFIPKNK